MIHHADNTKREDIIARIHDWNIRLTDLYNRIERWADEMDGAEVLRTEVPQAREELMQRFGVEPGKLPARAVIQGKRRVSFVPLALWVIGSNGRVNITTNSHSYILLDESEGESASRWVVVSTARRSQRIPLDREVLRGLIQDEDLFA